MQPIARGLDQVLAGLGLPPAAALAKLSGAWEQASGDLAERCAVEGLKDRTLYVVAADSVSASEIKWDAQRLVEEINTAADETLIDSVSVRVDSTRDRALAEPPT